MEFSGFVSRVNGCVLSSVVRVGRNCICNKSFDCDCVSSRLSSRNWRAILVGVKLQLFVIGYMQLDTFTIRVSYNTIFLPYCLLNLCAGKYY